ncbi:unnamed protein product [Lampetra planeri]
MGRFGDKMGDEMGDKTAARALSVTAIVFVALGILAGVVGAKCTTCIGDDVTMGSRVALILAGVAQLVPSS